ncbi:HAMP domain-containing sensor histidine kinase [Nocardiopsis sp. MG754419]|uniref:sensor histidine kinase n=1 Tax=Nocardiopsis sp. MG754419 TaxID=2259865 RepID=UPI001BA6B463|nr:HAMP domain-containing sensor histidine kinase [Nocardiopsis sp. MG754419]MBR8741201.1 sensor histidine kinase [Nocardiopsis sp. MG754419]
MNLAGRLILRSLLVMVLVLGGVTVLTHELVLASGRADVDHLLREEAELLSTALGDQIPAAAGRDGVVSGPEAEHGARQALAIRPSGARHVSLVHINGVRLQSTGGPSRVAALMRGGDAPVAKPGSVRTVETEIGRLRVLDTTLVDETDGTIAVVTLVSSLETAHDTAATVLLFTSVAGAVGLGLGGVALWLVVRRTLRPVREVSVATKAISPTGLATRVPVPDTRDEIAELAGEINGMLARIEGADAERRQYLAAISHEVRTPLAVAEGHLELLGGQEARIVRAELVRLRRVLEDLMAVARGGDEVDAERGPVFLPDLFDEVRSRAEALSAREAVTVTDPPPQVLLGDQNRLEQCLANLIGNAIDHNPPGTRVTLSARGTEEEIVLVVRDDGPGIDPDVLPRVFEPFVTTRVGEAGRIAGLGLAVVRSLVRAQGGRVDLDSGPEGTSVTIGLPRATV